MKVLAGIVLIGALVAVGAVQGANDDCFACCSTEGPDCYADGTPVADGEAYALVYTQKGSVFAGFKADGSLVDETASELVMTLPKAKGGRCEPTLCVLAKAYASKRTTGTWELVLLDTRKADRRPAGLGEDGSPVRVNAWGFTQSTVRFTESAFPVRTLAGGSSPWETGVVASKPSLLPANVPQPRVTGISVAGERVSLTVADTVPYLTYDVAGGKAPASVGTDRVAVEKRDGAAAQEIVIEADGARSRFFKVVVDRRGGL